VAEGRVRAPYRGILGGAMDISSHMRNRARDLRQVLTRAERRLWSCLRGQRMAGCKFRRRHPVGGYVLDFYSEELRLAIELDGHHHETHEMARYDGERTLYLRRGGIEVMRIPNQMLWRDAEVIERWLAQEIQRRREGRPHE